MGIELVGKMRSVAAKLLIKATPAPAASRLVASFEADLGVSFRGLELGLIGGGSESARFFEEADLIGGGFLRKAEGLPGDEGV